MVRLRLAICFDRLSTLSRVEGSSEVDELTVLVKDINGQAVP